MDFVGLPAGGLVYLVNSVCNTSCLTAFMSIDATTARLPTDIYLVLFDAKGQEDKANLTAQRLMPISGCQAGNSPISCSFTATGLNTLAAYHLWILFAGLSSSSVIAGGDALVALATRSSAGM